MLLFKMGFWMGSFWAGELLDGELLDGEFLGRRAFGKGAFGWGAFGLGVLLRLGSFLARELFFGELLFWGAFGGELLGGELFFGELMSIHPKLCIFAELSSNSSCCLMSSYDFAFRQRQTKWQTIQYVLKKHYDVTADDYYVSISR